MQTKFIFIRLTLGQTAEAARGYNLFAVTLLTCFQKKATKKEGEEKKVKREIKEVLFVDGSSKVINK